MNMQSQLDKLSFARQRADYYDDLASLLESASGIKQLQIFVLDAERYEGKARGRLSAAWAERYTQNGANLAKTWSGYLPDEDVAIIHAQQDLGAKALVQALRDLSRMARITAKLRNVATATLGVGALAVVLAVCAATVLPVWATHMLEQSFGLTTDKWGPTGQSFAAWAQTVQQAAPLLAMAVALALWFAVWSPAHWTGSARSWADKHILFYKLHHEISAMRLALTLSTLTRQNARTFTLIVSLQALQENTTSAWGRAQIQLALDTMANTGADDYTVFKNGIFTQDMYWRLQDVSGSKTLSEALQAVSDAVPQIWLPRLERQMAAWRWILLVCAVVSVMFVSLQLQATMAEFKDAISNAAAS